MRMTSTTTASASMTAATAMIRERTPARALEAEQRPPSPAAFDRKNT
jgi:hypothetical protein